LKNPYARLDKREMGRVLIQTSEIIANCSDSFEMNRALPELYPDKSSMVNFRGSAGILGALTALTGALPAFNTGLYRLYHAPDHPR
jgi:hypothetical protein